MGGDGQGWLPSAGPRPGPGGTPGGAQNLRRRSLQGQTHFETRHRRIPPAWNRSSSSLKNRELERS